jgi:chromatin segregation and condensation protein Rec8/ScpA/Scc1 (kleisin family)
MDAEPIAAEELDSRSLGHVKLPVFEGPLDLLLYLIKKDELDIYDIPIEQITRRYLEYLRLIKMLDLEVAGEYLVVASTLLYIKSRVLLPQDQRPPEDEAEEDDPRWELVRQLVEYKKYKDAAFELSECLAREEKVHRRGAALKPETGEAGLAFDNPPAAASASIRSAAPCACRLARARSRPAAAPSATSAGSPSSIRSASSRP